MSEIRLKKQLSSTTGTPPVDYYSFFVDSADNKLKKKDDAGAVSVVNPDAVDSVFGRTGAIVAQSGDYTKSQVGLGSVDNTSDANKPISTATQTALNLKEDLANKGVANGYCPLDVTSKVPSVHLPSYVDDVEEYANLASFPVTGETGKLYVSLATNLVYRWTGSVYVEISPSPGSTDVVPEGSSNLYFTASRVLNTTLSGYAVGANAVLAATDTILAAFGKSQGQLNAKANQTITISSGAGLAGGGNLSANRIISMPNVGTSGSYGSASSVPVITTDTQGRVSGVVNTAISILSSAITDLAATVRSTVLTGISFTSSTAVVATDSILVAIGKLQAQFNKILYLTQASTVSTTSDVTFTNLTDLQFTGVTGVQYRCKWTIQFQSTSTTTGIALALGGTATAGISMRCTISVGADGTGSIWMGNLINNTGDLTTGTGVQGANTTYIAMIEGIINVTTGGTIFPRFRSEVAGSQVSVMQYSIGEIRTI